MPPISITFCSGSRSITGYGRLRLDLRRVRAVEPDGVARELDDRDVHPEADSEERDLALAGEAAGEDLALEPREPKPPGTRTPSTVSSSACASSSDIPSASNQRTRTEQPWWTPACLSASCTER